MSSHGNHIKASDIFMAFNVDAGGKTYHTIYFNLYWKLHVEKTKIIIASITWLFLLDSRTSHFVLGHGKQADKM